MTSKKCFPVILVLVFMIITRLASAKENEVNSYTSLCVMWQFSIVWQTYFSAGLHGYCKRWCAIACVLNIGGRFDSCRSNYKRNSLEHRWWFVLLPAFKILLNFLNLICVVIAFVFRASDKSTDSIWIDSASIFSRSARWQFVSIRWFGWFEEVALYNTATRGQCTMSF